MSRSWEEYEDQEVIDEWREKKIKLADNGERAVYISRRLLCNILNKLYSEGSLKPGEEFDTEFIEGKGWTPPLEIWREKDGTRARKRNDDEVLDPYNSYGRGKTLREIKKFREEAAKASGELEELFDICPRCQCPARYCSAHC